MLLKVESYTAIVVDDDTTNAHGIARALERLGHEVVGVFHDGESGLAAIRALEPALVIMDIQLGGPRSGVQIAARVLETQDIPIVFVTGLQDPDLSAVAAADGIFGFLHKPFDVNTLRAAVELVRVQQAARATHRSLERRYRALFEQAAIGVAEIEASGRVAQANRKFAAIFGTPVGTAIDLFERACEADRARLSAAFGSSEQVVEVECRTMAGAPVWVRFTIAPLEPARGGAVERHVAMVEDITDRVATQRQLARHHHMLEESQRMGEIGSYRFDLATRRSEWTRQLFHIYG
ncbi:MAG TPA: response regulator, partial [Kofleriaceae bacterium]|nr:response regulator [Kofleriaceae bacterium]